MREHIIQETFCDNKVTALVRAKKEGEMYVNRCENNDKKSC